MGPTLCNCFGAGDAFRKLDAADHDGLGERGFGRESAGLPDQFFQCHPRTDEIGPGEVDFALHGDPALLYSHVELVPGAQGQVGIRVAGQRTREPDGVPFFAPFREERTEQFGAGGGGIAVQPPRESNQIGNAIPGDEFVASGLVDRACDTHGVHQRGHEDLVSIQQEGIVRDIAGKPPQREVRPALRIHRPAVFGEPLNPDVPARSPAVRRLEQPACLADELGNLFGSFDHVRAGMHHLADDVDRKTAQPRKRDLDIELVQALADRVPDLPPARAKVESGQLDGAHVRNHQFAFRANENGERDGFLAGLDMDAEGIAGTDDVALGTNDRVVSDLSDPFHVQTLHLVRLKRCADRLAV